MAAIPSIRPSWIERLNTHLSGQGTGRIGNSAGVLGSRGTPTSMRGRFAKFGGMFDNETGAQAAMATTAQASNALRSGAMARAAAGNQFNARAYEQQQRQLRGMGPRSTMVGGTAGGGSTQLPTTFPPPVPTAKPTPPEQFNAVGDSSPVNPTALAQVQRSQFRARNKPGRINWTNKYQEGFTTQRETPPTKPVIAPTNKKFSRYA